MKLWSKVLDQRPARESLTLVLGFGYKIIRRAVLPSILSQPTGRTGQEGSFFSKIHILTFPPIESDDEVDRSRGKKNGNRNGVPAGHKPVAVSFQRNDCIIASLIMHVVIVMIMIVVNMYFLFLTFRIHIRPCLVHTENQNFFKISRHIKSWSTCMKH